VKEIYCPTCKKITPHEVLKERGREGVAKCTVCGTVHPYLEKEERKVKIKVIISDGERSWTEEMEEDPEVEFKEGEVIEVKGLPVKITKIEVEGGKRKKRALAKEAFRIWGIRYDRIRVKFSLHRGPITIPFYVYMAPDEEVQIGDIYQVGSLRGVVFKIKLKKGVINRGSAKAEEIVRVYCRELGRRKKKAY